MAAGDISKDKIYKVEEVVKHSTEEDCWIIYESKVYDVTAFLSEHPGGEDLILGEAGGDATESFENAAHSAKAHEMLQNYLIGEVNPDELRTWNLEKGANKTEKGGATTTGGVSFSNVLSSLLPLLLLVIAVGISLYVNPSKDKVS